MTEPATEAGRRLLADVWAEDGWREVFPFLPDAILAIEQEARADLAAENERLRKDLESIRVFANVHLAESCPNLSARDDLAARIVAAVEELPRHSPDDRPVVRLTAVLDAIREASDERA